MTPRTLRLQVAGLLLAALAPGAFAIDTSIDGAIKQVSGPPSQTFIYADYSHAGPTTYADAATYFISSGDDNPYNFSATVSSAADGYGAHAAAYVTGSRPYGVYPSSTTSIQKTATASANVTFSDVLVTGMGLGSTPTMTRFFTQLDGAASVGANLYTSGHPGDASATSQVSISMAANGSSIGYGYFERDQAGGSNPTSTGGGLLQNFSGSGTLASGLFAFTPNVPFSVTLSLSAGAYIGLVDQSGGGMLANCDFSNTFSFLTNGPVFDLPAGYTVNSPSAHIVNNRFVVAQPTPEPSALAALGLGALALLRRRKRA